MRHWLQIATRNWRTRPGRAILASGAVALGVGVVVWVTCCYESVRQSVTDAVLEWIGRSHIIIEPVEGVWAVFDEDVLKLVASVDGVAETTVRTREYVEAVPTGAKESDYERIEISGIIPEKEETFRKYELGAGRFIKATDENGLLVERLLADEFKLHVGDRLKLRSENGPAAATDFTVLGIVERRRASINQAPMVWGRMIDVQRLCKLPGKVKSVDIMLRDPSVANIRKTAEDIRKLVDERRGGPQTGDHGTSKLEVKTTEAQLQKLSAAQGLLQFIMTQLACVVLLTALFIILAAMSMGVTERITELGLLRCVGVTRGQMVRFVLTQTLPLGIIGTLAGVPLGLLLQAITLWIAPQYVGHMAYSATGIALGIAGGLGTTLLGAAIPAMSASWISPVEAVRAHSSIRVDHWAIFCGCAALLLLGTHEWIKRSLANETLSGFDLKSLMSLLTLYAAGTAIAPLIILIAGGAAAWIISKTFRLAPGLLIGEIRNAPFRSAAICSGLMVGLSLIVGLAVWGESVKEGWQFPKEFPDAMLYTYESIPLEMMRPLAKTPGVGQFTVADDFAFALSKPSIFRPLRILDEFSRFLAIDVDTGLPMVKMAFLEGTEREATARLKKGGAILITREFSQARKLHVGDSLKLWVEKDSGTFQIAGVVASPGLDIAISYFNASTYFQTYSVGAVIGTLEDAEKLFHRRYGKLILVNFDFATGDESQVAGHEKLKMPSASERKEAEKKISPTGRPTFALGPGPVPGDGPEENVVNEMLNEIGYPPKAFVTARALKREIDQHIDRVTLLLAVIPMVGLVISALGLANLMASNVTSRMREIAVLRAVGLTRGQLTRLVIGEAVVLGILGSVMGMALGLGLGRVSTTLTLALSGFSPPLTIPWRIVFAGAAMAIAMCLIAGLGPARRAGRSDIVSVLGEL